MTIKEFVRRNTGQIGEELLLIDFQVREEEGKFLLIDSEGDTIETFEGHHQVTRLINEITEVAYKTGKIHGAADLIRKLKS